MLSSVCELRFITLESAPTRWPAHLLLSCPNLRFCVGSVTCMYFTTLDRQIYLSEPCPTPHFYNRVIPVPALKTHKKWFCLDICVRCQLMNRGSRGGCRSRAELMSRLHRLWLCQSRLLPGELRQKPFSGGCTAKVKCETSPGDTRLLADKTVKT